jgi:hypothetical protein
VEPGFWGLIRLRILLPTIDVMSGFREGFSEEA